MHPSYALFWSAPSSFSITYGLLTLSLLNLWCFPSLRLTPWLYLAGLASGYYYHLLSSTALGTCLLLFYLSWVQNRSDVAFWRVLAHGGNLLIAFSLFWSLIPGFTPWVIGHQLQLSQQTVPFVHAVFFEHAALTISLLSFGLLPLLKRPIEWLFYARQVVWIALFGMLTVSILTLSIDYVSWDFTWTNYYYAWAFTQLFYFCAGEEVVFRGLIQAPLSRNLGRWRIGNIEIGHWISLLIASAAYCLRHVYQGREDMIFTAVASLFYGYAFLRYRRLEASMFVHLAINSIHFLAFTYPVLF